MLIREEREQDHPAIWSVNRLAFEQPDEADLVDRLRADGVVIVSLVAEDESGIAGHILFSDLLIETESSVLHAVALAPVSVKPERQGQGIGSKLIEAGMAACRERGKSIVIVLGHADYYPRFGFSAELARPLLHDIFSGDVWMAAELTPGALAGVTGDGSLSQCLWLLRTPGLPSLTVISSEGRWIPGRAPPGIKRAWPSAIRGLCPRRPRIPSRAIVPKAR